MKTSDKLTLGCYDEVNRALLRSALRPIEEAVYALRKQAEAQTRVSHKLCAAENLDVKYCVEYATACEVMAVCNALINKIYKSKT